MKEETKTSLPSVEDIISDKETAKLYSIEKIKHLESENLQLREALKRITTMESWMSWEGVGVEAVLIAEQALKKTT